MKREVGEGGGLRESIFPCVVAILNAFPRDPCCCSLRAEMRETEVWDQHLVLNTGYGEDEEALPLPGEPSSRILHRQAMMLSGFPSIL